MPFRWHIPMLLLYFGLSSKHSIIVITIIFNRSDIDVKRELFSLSLSNSLRWFLNKRRTWESNGVCVFCFSRVPNQLNDSLRKKDIRLIWLFQQQKGFTATIIFITLCYSCVRVCFSCYFVTSFFSIFIISSFAPFRSLYITSFHLYLHPNATLFTLSHSSAG